MADNPPVLVDPDVLARLKRDAAYLAGQLACRQLQPLSDNPHTKGHRDELLAWVSGWQSLRDLVEERDKLREKTSRLEKTLAIRQRTLEDINGALVDAMDRAERQEDRAEFAEQAVRDAMEAGLERVGELQRENLDNLHRWLIADDTPRQRELEAIVRAVAAIDDPIEWYRSSRCWLCDKMHNEPHADDCAWVRARKAVGS